MKMSGDEVVAALNILVEVNRDGKRGYETAADAIESSDYQALFLEYAAQRAQFADELSALIRQYGGNPTDNGDLAATFHRAWINIKSAVTAGDDSAIMAECARGEEVAIRAYQDAMAKDLPDDVRTLVRHQFTDVKIAYERVRALNAALK